MRLRATFTSLRNRNFLLYFSGVIMSELGVRGTLSINLYHLYVLTGSTALVGVVGLFQFVSLVILAPFGGAIAPAGAITGASLSFSTVPPDLKHEKQRL